MISHLSEAKVALKHFFSKCFDRECFVNHFYIFRCKVFHKSINFSIEMTRTYNSKIDSFFLENFCCFNNCVNS
jgi:hypothetical protein